VSYNPYPTPKRSRADHEGRKSEISAARRALHPPSDKKQQPQPALASGPTQQTHDLHPRARAA